MKHLAITLLPLLLIGCSMPSEPGTTVEVHPADGRVYFHDTKDNTLVVEDFNFDPSTKTVSFKKLSLDNNASDVRRANVEQIQAYTEQVRTVSAMAAQMTQTLASMLPYVRPATTVQIDTPQGGATLTRTPVLPSAPLAPPPPTSQPATP